MENLQYKNDKLYILDQRLLPNEEKWIEIKNKEQAFDAIKDLAEEEHRQSGYLRDILWRFFLKIMVYMR